MAQRTETELKVFLEGTLAQYNALTDKTGTVFFDKDNHAVYAKGECIIQSNIKDVTYNSTSTELIITPFTGDDDKIVINLGIQKELDDLKTTLETWAGNRFVRYDAGNQGLTDAQKSNARTNIGVENAVNNLTSDSITAPLSAAQGKELKRQIDEKVTGETGKGLSTNDYTDGDKAKLDGIEKEAQKNRNVVAIDTAVGNGNNNDAIVLTGNLVNKSKASSGEVGFSLSHRYDANDKRIYFFNSATAPTTGTTGYIFYIDTIDFVKDGMLANATYDNDTHILTLIFNTTATDSGVENIEVNLSKLVDVYKAGVGLTLADGTFNFNYGAGLTIDEFTQEVTVDVGDGLQIDTDRKITLKPAPNGGLNVTTNGLAINSGYGLDIDDNNEIFVDIDTNNGLKWTTEGRFGVDFTKAPVQSVNGQTGVVNIDVTPKVWSF